MITVSFTFSYGTGPVRFVHLFSYPKQVSREESEQWYLNVHVPAARALPGVVSFRSWKALPPISMWTFDPYDRFDRLSELVFEDMESCLNATVRNAEFWRAGAEDAPGFRELECVLLDEEPQYNLLKDVPVQQYRYINHPGRYTAGTMLDTDRDDVIMDVYMFNYDPRFTFEEGEDWYLGHHVREGRITKRLGHRHYLTWKPLRVEVAPDCPLQPNRFWRLTELGLPAYAADPAQAGLKPGERPASMIYTQDPRGQVIGEWRNILIDPAQAENLMG